MNPRLRAVVVLGTFASAILYMGLMSISGAQVCPPPANLCRSEGGLIWCGDCSDPDSGSTDSTFILMGLVSPERPTSGFSIGIATPVVGVPAQPMFEAVAHGASGPLADVLLLRQQVRDQWKWIVSTESLGTSSVKSTLKVMHEGSTVASATGAAGASLGEISEFPSRLAIATTRSATTVTWGFAKPVEVRVAGRTGTLGSLQKANEVSVTFPVGAPKGLSSIELKRRGVGRLSWPSAKTTLIAPAAKAP